MAITIINQHRVAIPIIPSQIKNQVKKILTKENLKEKDIAIAFVDKKEIKKLNKKFLRKSRLTDVLSFESSQNYYKKIVSGDIAICTDAAVMNSKIFKTSPEFELKLYLIHGLLHLMGYNDKNIAQRKRIRQKEKEILNFVNKK
ncbi:MAG: rRNA maturation RNase YbeY [Candidatus Omnitrophota bacterium]|nr:rRNA maturation RNase YbeY [Candidatus Omnitrophota bacterium]